METISKASEAFLRRIFLCDRLDSMKDVSVEDLAGLESACHRAFVTERLDVTAYEEFCNKVAIVIDLMKHGNRKKQSEG